MLKWIKAKCTKSGEPVKLDVNQCVRVMAAEIKELRERLERLETLVLQHIFEQPTKESKIEFKPAPKKVGRPRKK